MAGHSHHDHDHREPPHAEDHGRGGSRKRLIAVFALTAAYMMAEIVGGILSNSLALLADAGHMLTDVAALGLSVFALWAAGRPPTARYTYGFYRGEILAALANGATLIAIALLIFVEAYKRLSAPPEVAGSLVAGVAVGGLVVNLLGLWIHHGGRSESLNVAARGFTS